MVHLIGSVLTKRVIPVCVSLEGVELVKSYPGSRLWLVLNFALSGLDGCKLYLSCGCGRREFTFLLRMLLVMLLVPTAFRPATQRAAKVVVSLSVCGQLMRILKTALHES